MAIRKIKRGHTRYPGETWEGYRKRMKPERVGIAMDVILSGEDRQFIGKETDACHVIEAHHELMKHDPDRLSSKFMQLQLGRKCKEPDEKLLEEHEQFMKKSNRYGRYVDPDYEFRKKKLSKSKPKRKPVKKCRCK